MSLRSDEHSIAPLQNAPSPPRSRWVAVASSALLAWLTVVSVAVAGDAGVVAGVNGSPTITHGAQTRPIRPGDAITIGDRIHTDAAAKVKVLLADDSVLSVGPRSDVIIDTLLIGGSDRSARLRVLAGRFKLAVAAWFGGGSSDVEVATPTAIAGVRGTVLWGDTELDAICDLHGVVQVRALQGDAQTTLAAGSCVTGMGKGATMPLVPSPADLQRYLRQVTLD